MIRLDDQSFELVDAIVAAIDADRIAEVDRIGRALAAFGLDEAFTTELRLSGLSSLTWGRCELCSDIVDSFEMSEEVAA